ncbi:hypothetical protein PTTG_28823 [Puccinia triticina 1-1 BBBD Race 1]|uniref:CCHC-type domain-containing protein n=1 Tax=Puccinia triticina (isolate 1-1 / race 1 (BBBD)) TaxID=630390 RepID=A0A180G9A8_PUCT1|nr:hypothetical protein PTTG_28823 [Puccinia triticina 1-1 BBBD Race 1]
MDPNANPANPLANVEINRAPHQQARLPVPVNLADNRNASAIISAVSGHIRDADRLLADGKRLRDAINDPDYLAYESTSAHHERIARSILISSVNRSLQQDLQRLPFASSMLIEICARFNVVSQAAQLNCFQCLLRFNVSNHPTAATMAAGINNKLDELAQLNITPTRNQLAGLILQNSLGSEPELMEEVDRCIEQSLSRSRTGTVEDFKSIIRTIGIVRQNLQHQTKMRSQGQQTSTAPALAMNVGVNRPAPPQQPVFSGKGQYSKVEAAATRAGVCFLCRSPGHIQRNCPNTQHPWNGNRSFAPPALKISTRKPANILDFNPSTRLWRPLARLALTRRLFRQQDR